MAIFTGHEGSLNGLMRMKWSPDSSAVESLWEILDYVRQCLLTTIMKRPAKGTAFGSFIPPVQFQRLVFMPVCN